MRALRRKQFTESREEGVSWPMGLAAALWLLSIIGRLLSAFYQDFALGEGNGFLCYFFVPLGPTFDECRYQILRFSMFAVEGAGKDLAWIDWGACMAVPLAVALIGRAAWNSAMGDGSRARRARWAAAICWVLATVVCIGLTWLLRCRLGVFADRSEAYIDFCARLTRLVAWGIFFADVLVVASLFVPVAWRPRMAKQAMKAG